MISSRLFVGFDSALAKVGASWVGVLWLLALTVGFGGLRAATGEAEGLDDLSAGPAAHRFSLTLSPGVRSEYAGPFFYRETTPEHRQWAIPPLMSYTLREEVDHTEFDFLYPVISYDRFGKEWRFHIFQLLSFAGGDNQAETPTRRFTVFPFYFQQRSSDSNLNYTALLPFYGHLQGRLFRDEMFFVAAPVYVRSRKRDVITDNVLFPFFHVRRGDGLRGWQLWPVAGREVKEITTFTNRFGDPERSPGHIKQFLAWPFVIDQRLQLGTDNPQTNRLFLPFAAWLRSPNQDRTSVLWPFFTVVNDRARAYREWNGPWPFFTTGEGTNRSVFRLWPVYGKTTRPGVESTMALWPVYRHTHKTDTHLDRKQTRILGFVYGSVDQHTVGTEDRYQRRSLWPLFTWERLPGDRTRFQALALLEPVVARNRSIERNYSPLWSFWRQERNPTNGTSSASALWNLYRREVDTQRKTRKDSIFFGLFQYHSGPDGSRASWFHRRPRAGRPETEAGRAGSSESP